MTPPPTKVLLVGTLVVTVATAALFLVRLGGGEPVRARLAAWFLMLLALLFAMRVAGQLVVILRRPRWLPPMASGQWNLMPYRLLLPIQLVFLAVMAGLIASLFAEAGPPADPAPAFGAFLLVFAAIYAAAMAVRYVVRMARRPEQRWFGGTIPIVFHWVLATFLLVFGSFHASH